MLKKYGKKIQKKNSEKTDSSDSRRDDWLLNGTGWGLKKIQFEKSFERSCGRLGRRSVDFGILTVTSRIPAVRKKDKNSTPVSTIMNTTNETCVLQQRSRRPYNILKRWSFLCFVATKRFPFLYISPFLKIKRCFAKGFQFGSELIWNRDDLRLAPCCCNALNCGPTPSPFTVLPVSLH